MDIKRHLNNEPVVARPSSTTYKLQKAWRRHKAVFAAVTAVAIALVAGIGVSAWQASVATRARNDAQANLRKAVAAEGKVQKALDLAQHERDLALRAAVRIRKQMYVADIGLAHKAIQEGNLGRARALLAKHIPSSNDEDLRGFEWRFLASRAKGNSRADLGRYIGFLSGAAISPDGQFVALNRRDPPRLEVIHLASGAVAKSIRCRMKWCPGLLSKGSFLAGAHQGKVVGWDTNLGST
jgi:hypothetical protein